MTIRLPLLPTDPDAPFPSPGWALRDPDGLLAMGGDLSPTRLLNAYRHGIFPWFSAEQPILWWCPDPRMVFDTESFRLPSRFARQLRKSPWQIRTDSAFDQVIEGCAHTPRPGQPGTWISPPMVRAYQELHQLGHAHSIEVFDQEKLVGGIYGVAIGRMFFGESMFSRQSGASKAALAGLIRQLRQWHWPLLDAQVENPHLVSLGARRMARPDFLAQVSRLTAEPVQAGSWQRTCPPFPASALATSGRA